MLFRSSDGERAEEGGVVGTDDNTDVISTVSGSENETRKPNNYLRFVMSVFVVISALLICVYL